ncbi:MAG TPA: ABC transporter ATP-binding protein [Thermotogota bacterium]|nr:ABC transporter ATP-binding protein [Thermotogota bacterium]HRW93560.1 ABC transporter ATP-binding protein [Thermotogota bacterium]
MIQFQEVQKVFGNRKKTVHALKGINFRVESGEIFGLLGPNGAGKTTALRILSTLLQPTSGEAHVGGFHTVRDSREVRKQIGFLSSDMNLSGNLSARDYITFFGRLNHIPEVSLKKRVESLLEYFDMKDYADRKVATYSTGMKQKTLISIALVHEPSIVVFDEPTNGLDVMTAKLVLDSLRELRQQGKTVVLSTHQMDVAQKMCDRLAIIDHGEVKAMGTLDEILSSSGSKDLEEAFFAVVKEDAQ